MKNFIIADLERLSDIKAHTIRSWEKRYQILAPSRNKNNTRSYSITDLKKLLSISLFTQYGYKISQIILLSESEILKRSKNLSYGAGRQQMKLHELMLYMYSMETNAFEETLDACFKEWPAKTVIHEIISPFLERTELLWHGKRLVEEHLVVTVLRRKILSNIEQHRSSQMKKTTVLLFLPDTCHLDLSLLCAFLLLKNLGVDVIYMGDDVSTENLSQLFDTKKPDFLYTYLREHSNFKIEKLVSLMQEKLPAAELLITLKPGMHNFKCSYKKVVLKSFSDSIEYMSIE